MFDEITLPSLSFHLYIIHFCICAISEIPLFFHDLFLFNLELMETPLFAYHSLHSLNFRKSLIFYLLPSLAFDLFYFTRYELEIFSLQTSSKFITLRKSMLNANQNYFLSIHY